MKVLAVVVFVGVVTGAVKLHIRNELQEDWEAYKERYGKAYETDAHELTRRAIWEANLKKIEHHNLRHSMGEVTFRLGVNGFADMTGTEFTEMMNGFKRPEKVDTKNRATFLAPLNVRIPAAVDWRKEGYVTEVKNQGPCGSCWAFSATGGLEGQWFRKSGKLISLSEQELLDCSKPQGNHGCSGGYMDQAFEYIQENGIESEKDYPYEAVDEDCWDDPNKKIARDTGFVDIPTGDEKALQTAVATVGPISIAIDASQTSFQLYESGVYNEANCTTVDLDHGVLIVGYDHDAAGGDYYIVKNSWGVDWGQKGYIWMSRNKGNQCGVASLASYPTV